MLKSFCVTKLQDQKTLCQKKNKTFYLVSFGAANEFYADFFFEYSSAN